MKSHIARRYFPSLIVLAVATLLGGASFGQAAEAPLAEPREPSPKSLAILEKLRALDISVDREEWTVDLSFTTNLDAALKLIPDLDELRGVRLGDEATDAHVAAVARLRRLTRFEISGNAKITDAAIATIGEMKQLRILGISVAPTVTPAGLTPLKGLTELEALSLDYTRVGGQAGFLASFKKLRKLNLDGCELRTNDLASLAGPTALEDLQLGHNSFGPAGLFYLGRLTNLKRLDLTANNIDDAGIQHLAGLANLESLSLGHTDVSDVGLNVLAGMKKLKSLDLGGTAIVGYGLKHLAGAAELESLDFGYLQHFTGRGLEHLAGCPNLTSLNLHLTGITDDGLASIAKLKQLRQLELPWYGSEDPTKPRFFQEGQAGRLTDEGLKHLGTMSNLEELKVSGHGMTDAGLVHLKGMSNLRLLSFGVAPNIKGPGIAQLAALPKLELLWMARTGVTDAGAGGFSSLTRVRSLDVPRGMTPAAMEQLKGMAALEYLIAGQKWKKEEAKVKAMLPKFKELNTIGRDDDE